QRKARLLTAIQRPAGKLPPAAPNNVKTSGTLQNLHRLPLSQDDFYAKDKILQLLPANEQTGTVYQSQNVVIEYIATTDTFQAEILTTTIASAKSEAASWFISEGMSQQGICEVPLAFYLNNNIEKQLGPEA